MLACSYFAFGDLRIPTPQSLSVGNEGENYDGDGCDGLLRLDTQDVLNSCRILSTVCNELAIQECVAKALERRLRWNICMLTVPPSCCCNVEVRVQHV